MRKRTTGSVARTCRALLPVGVAIVVVMLALIARSQPVEAATITVTTTADDSPPLVDNKVSLREAIRSINNGADLNTDVTAQNPTLVDPYGTNDTINFNIPGVGPHTITLTGSRT